MASRMMKIKQDKAEIDGTTSTKGALFSFHSHIFMELHNAEPISSSNLQTKPSDI